MSYMQNSGKDAYWLPMKFITQTLVYKGVHKIAEQCEQYRAVKCTTCWHRSLDAAGKGFISQDRWKLAASLHAAWQGGPTSRLEQLQKGCFYLHSIQTRKEQHQRAAGGAGV